MSLIKKKKEWIIEPNDIKGLNKYKDALAINLNKPLKKLNVLYI